MILKRIFSLLFFEHGYLAKYLSYRCEIFNRGRKHSYAGKRVSDLSLRAKFLIYVKKRVTFGHFMKLNFVDFIK